MRRANVGGVSRDRSFEDQRAAIDDFAKTAKLRDRFTWEGFDVVVFER